MGYFFIICKENPNKHQIEVEGWRWWISPKKEGGREKAQDEIAGLSASIA